MWPLVLALLRRNAVYITLPFAGVVGYIGYNLESFFSDKYTPYSPSIQEMRVERLVAEAESTHATEVTNLRRSAGVLDINLPPSLQSKKN